MAVLAALGFAGTAAAVPAPPNLLPVVDSLSDSPNPIAVNKWFVATTASPYSARYYFATAIENDGAGPFQIAPAAAGTNGPNNTRLVKAKQIVTGDVDTALTNVRLVGTPLGLNVYDWGIAGIAKYTLQPSSGGPALDSSLGAVCRDDSQAVGTPPPALFQPANCAGLDGNATSPTFSSGITNGYRDVIDLNSASTPFFDVTSAPLGDASFVAQVDPFNEITESNDNDNTSFPVTLVIPGVRASAATLPATTATAPTSGQLAATIVGDKVPGKAPGQAVAALPDGTLTFSLAGTPANGTAQVSATGQATYTAKAGFSGTDSFTYIATDSRGLQSTPTTVSVTVNAAPGTGGTAGTGGTTVTRVTLKLKPSYSVVRKGNKTFLKVTGTLPASQVGRFVKIQRKIGKRIATVGSAKIGRTGRYTALIRVKTSRVSLRVTIAASTTAKGSTTAFKSLVVTKGS